MARAVRIEFAGAVYHVMCRGNNGQDVFLSDRDRICFLKTLEESCDQTGWIVHAFVLMGNHYHLLLETPEANLVAGMKWLQGSYTQRFNSMNKRRGHLFQGRYKSLLIDPGTPEYFSTVSTYIHLNPVRAGLCDAPGSFPWSSCRYYIDSRLKRPKWLCVQRAIKRLGLSGSAAYKAYIRQRAVEELDPARADELMRSRASLRRGWIMGDEAFRHAMLDLMENQSGSGGDNLRGEQRKMHGEHQAERCLERALARLNLDEAELQAMKNSRIEKQAIAWLLKKHTVATASWIAARISMGHRVNVSRSVSSFDAMNNPDTRILKQEMLQCTG